jgi:putative tricarboxylic transport membrane protein
MKFPRRQFLHLTAGAAALPVVFRIARAQDYPARTITLVVPFPPGGSTDVAARIVADHMLRTLGQQIIVQNLSGAGGTTGSIRVMRADPDGYTILMGQMGTHAAAVALYPNLAYKPEVDFEPIGMVTAFPLIIAAKRDFPASDLKEFVAYLKANSTALNQAHAGVGSIFFTSCLLLNSIVGAKPTLVPFNGGAPAMNALVGGQVDYMCADIITGGAFGSRQDKSLWDRVCRTQSDLARRAHDRGSRPARIPGSRLERPVRAQGDAEADHRQIGRCTRQGP